MKLYTIDKEYLNYVYNNVDSEVMLSHIADRSKGRANVLVLKTVYKGESLNFAVPEGGAIGNKFDEKTVVKLNLYKQGENRSKGFIVSKLMPIDVTLVKEFKEINREFQNVEIEITKREAELIAKTQAHLRRLEAGKHVAFSTNVDKQLQFLYAREVRLKHGATERQIYNTDFKTNIEIAENCLTQSNNPPPRRMTRR